MCTSYRLHRSDESLECKIPFPPVYDSDRLLRLKMQFLEIIVIINFTNSMIGLIN